MMDLETFKKKSKENFLNIVCTQEINSIKISNLELLKILIKKFEEIDFPSWEFDDKSLMFNQEDIRFQLWARLEMVTNYYYHNLKLTIENFTEILDENVDLGYGLPFASQSLIYKEVYDRTSFLSKLFFDIEYFIQQLNSEISFITSTSDKKKSHYFKSMLEFIDADKSISINKIIDDVNNLYGQKLLKTVPNKSLEYFLVFDYISTLRNCFHNNGYSQKNLNNLNFGGIKIEIKKGEQASMDHSTIFILVFTMINILQDVTLKLISDYQTIWKDKYLHEMREFIEKNRDVKK